MNDDVRKVLIVDTNKALFRYLKKKFTDVYFMYYTEISEVHRFDLIIYIQQRSRDCTDFLNENNSQIPMIFPLCDKKHICALSEDSFLDRIKFIDMCYTKLHFVKELKLVLEKLSEGSIEETILTGEEATFNKIYLL